MKRSDFFGLAAVSILAPHVPMNVAIMIAVIWLLMMSDCMRKGD